MLRDDLLKLWQERDYAQLSIEQLESDTPANEAAVGQADGDAAQLGTDESRELVEAISQNVGCAAKGFLAFGGRLKRMQLCDD